MKVSIKLNDPRYEFLLGVTMVDGIAENMETGERADIVLVSLGFFFFEIQFIW